MENSCVSLARIAASMRKKDADLILLKALANNDNSKQQIYLGRDFDVLRTIPTGEVVAAGKTPEAWADFQGITESPLDHPSRPDRVSSSCKDNFLPSPRRNPPVRYSE